MGLIEIRKAPGLVGRARRRREHLAGVGPAMSPKGAANRAQIKDYLTQGKSVAPQIHFCETMKSIARSRRPVLLRLGIIRRGSLACQCEKLVITLRGKAPFIVDVEIPAALYNEEELKRAIEAALARREGASRSLELPKAMKDSRVSFGG